MSHHEVVRDEDEELRNRIMKQKGTEMPYSGKLLHNKAGGVYHCAECGARLFLSNSKFDSGCGWPSFDRTAADGVETRPDLSHFMVRTEVVCRECGSHLGHVFNDGPTETGKRYCINSVAMEFRPED